mgnify:CR=1 FL=1
MIEIRAINVVDTPVIVVFLASYRSGAQSLYSASVARADACR